MPQRLSAMLSTKAYSSVRPFVRALLPARVRAALFASFVEAKGLLASDFSPAALCRMPLVKIYAALDRAAASRNAEMHRLNAQAITALGNVDIDECVRN